MKRQPIHLAFVILLVVSFIIPAEATIQPSFQGLGALTGSHWSSATAVSADGSVVVGWSWPASGWEAFRWENGTMTGLGDLPGGDFGSLARSVSVDGSVIVGASHSASGTEAFRWENGTMAGLVDLPGGKFESYADAYGVSADGSVVVGARHSASGWEAFRGRWYMIYSLGDLPGGNSYSWARAVSADGSVVVGESISTSGLEVFRWEDLNGNGEVDPDEKLDKHPEFGLGDLPGGDFRSEARDVSADGLVVVGQSDSALGEDGEAFRWEDGKMIGLGDLPGGRFYSWARAVSADGSVVVGYGTSASGIEASIWDEYHGMRSLKDVLENDCGLDLMGWRMGCATDISADGLTIVGYGTNPYGNEEGWIATIPEPATLLLLGLGALRLRSRQAVMLRRKQ